MREQTRAHRSPGARARRTIPCSSGPDLSRAASRAAPPTRSPRVRLDETARGSFFIVPRLAPPQAPRARGRLLSATWTDRGAGVECSLWTRARDAWTLRYLPTLSTEAPGARPRLDGDGHLFDVTVPGQGPWSSPRLSSDPHAERRPRLLDVARCACRSGRDGVRRRVARSPGRRQRSPLIVTDAATAPNAAEAPRGGTVFRNAPSARRTSWSR